MAPTTQILLSGALTFGAPLMLALRELVVLRRRRGNGGGWDKAPDPPPPPPKPLPDCLIPKPLTQFGGLPPPPPPSPYVRPTRVRELA